MGTLVVLGIQIIFGTPHIVWYIWYRLVWYEKMRRYDLANWDDTRWSPCWQTQCQVKSSVIHGWLWKIYRTSSRGETKPSDISAEHHLVKGLVSGLWPHIESYSWDVLGCDQSNRESLILAGFSTIISGSVTRFSWILPCFFSSILVAPFLHQIHFGGQSMVPRGNS